MGLQQPLLAGESKEEYPSLSGPSNVEEELDTPLSRLIAESTPQEALMPYSPGWDETVANQAHCRGSNASASSPTTLLAGTLIVLCWGFTWGAFFSNSWMDSHLRLTLGWQQKYLPWLDNRTDLVLQESSVFTISSSLREDKNYLGLMGLWICSVILPCVFMVVCPIWILTDYQLSNQSQMIAESQPSRAWLQLTVRLSFLVVFILLFLDIAIAGIELDWEDTNIQVHNELRGPYISFLLGCSCALLSVVVLKVPYLQHLHLFRHPPQRQAAQRSDSRSSERTPPPAAHAPPANAFRLPWLLSSNDDLDAASAETEPMLASQQPRTARTSSNNQAAASPQSSPDSGISYYQKVIVFQLGLLSLILWFPVMALGQFRVLYDGLVKDLVKDRAFNVYLWQMPGLIWRTGISAGTPKWVLVAVYALIFLFVLVLPLLAHTVATLVWMRRGKSRAFFWRDVLQLLQPLICGVPFSVAILVTVPSFIDIGENFDKDICQTIEAVVQNQCLISGGVRLAGSWFTFAQAVTLELFVLFTLRWTGGQKRQHEVV